MFNKHVHSKVVRMNITYTWRCCAYPWALSFLQFRGPWYPKYSICGLSSYTSSKPVHYTFC
jgi:hypothetical protein